MCLRLPLRLNPPFEQACRAFPQLPRTSLAPAAAAPPTTSKSKPKSRPTVGLRTTPFRTLITTTTTTTTTTTSTMSAASTPTSFDLYTYFRSSCAARLRIALNLKNIPYTPKFVNLLKGEQLSDEHRQLNPTGTVPVLVAHYHQPGPPSEAVAPATTTTKEQGKETFSVGQSLAALEFLEECETTTGGSRRSLLPPAADPQARARVRNICNIIACDIQPVTNLRVQKRIKTLDADATAWARDFAAAGFEALERELAELRQQQQQQQQSGLFCVGDAITLADVCLVPAVWAAERVGVDMEAYPVVKRVFERMLREEAVQGAHWKNQPDTPDELRW